MLLPPSMPSRWSRSDRYTVASPRAGLSFLIALLVGALAGCGGEGTSEAGVSDRSAEEVARCVGQGSGTQITDPLNARPVDFGLDPALRRRADTEPRIGEGSILPRPTAFAAFVGSDSTFVPPGFDGSGFAPAAFIFFDTPELAQAHEGQADVRRGRALIVFRGDSPPEQQEFIDGCF